MRFEIVNGKSIILCPDCPRKTKFQLNEVKKVVGFELFEKHMGFRLLAQMSPQLKSKSPGNQKKKYL